MTNFKLFLCSILLFSQSLFAISFDRYHDVSEINAFMKEEARLNPIIASYKSLGLSAEKREIGVLILSLKSGPKKEALYFNATHHGDEKSTTEAVLGLIQYFLKNKKALERYDLYFQPLVNPDGHANNRRVTSAGVDPNRDYSFPGKRDSDAFKQVEIQHVKKLVDEVKFKGALAYHSGIVEILWPWCYTDTPSKDVATFSTVTKEMAKATGVLRFMASNMDYATDGEFIDYLHWKYGTIALTVEISKKKTPPIEDIPTLIETTIKGAVSFIDSMSKLDKGILVTQEPNLLEGAVGSGRSAQRLE